MNLLKPLVPLLLLASFIYAQNSRGIAPMSSASGYSAHAEQEGAQIGATLLTHKQARKAFATADLNQCCLVVEVGLFPAKDNFIKIAAADFTLREAGKDIGMKPSSVEVLAAGLEVRPRRSRMSRKPESAVQIPSVTSGEQAAIRTPARPSNATAFTTAKASEWVFLSAASSSRRQHAPSRAGWPSPMS